MNLEEQNQADEDISNILAKQKQEKTNKEILENLE
ncbi:hypothetical protein LCGC14_1629010 [marine sediment metagenome]|uniref:Uncharacterized protein n=1 Tax=marine sediment metagenome TaxID=412755 RepID=A0A0F9L312_9ZZZZ